MTEHKLPCPIITDMLPLYIDGITSEATCKYIKEHLDACPECRQKHIHMCTSINNNKDEQKFEEQKKIDYLKKVKKSSTRKLIAGFLIALLIFGGGTFIKNYFMGYETESYTISNVDYDIHSGQINVNGTFEGGKSVYCRHEIIDQSDGTQKLIIYGSRKAPWKKDAEFSLSIPLELITESIEINDATVNKHGAFVSTMANHLREAWNPDITDMDVNEQIAQILGISTSLGDYEIRLGTGKNSDTLFFDFKSKVTDIRGFDQKMEAYACLLMASIDGLNKVSWSYTEGVTKDAEEHNASITRARGEELGNNPLMRKGSPTIFQCFVDYLAQFTYTIEE